MRDTYQTFVRQILAFGQDPFHLMGCKDITRSFANLGNAVLMLLLVVQNPYFGPVMPSAFTLSYNSSRAMPKPFANSSSDHRGPPSTALII